MAARRTGPRAGSVGSRRRRQILDAAAACITEFGADNTTMRKVAERAGVRHGTVAYHFKRRQQLIDATLLDMADAYMRELYSRGEPHGPEGPPFLARLVESFLDRDGGGANFVVQMIDVGLHDRQLRKVHDEFVQYGWDLIERSIRDGMATGEYRTDLDPQLAAKIIHSVLIWWGSELAGDAISREVALKVGRQAIDLLRPSGPTE